MRNFFRCTWCNRILWPWQEVSAGRTLHIRCYQYVTRITGETQKQYQATQVRLRREEEDRL